MCEINKAITTFGKIPAGKINKPVGFVLGMAVKSIRREKVDRMNTIARFRDKKQDSDRWREEVAQKTGSQSPENAFDAFRKVMGVSKEEMAAAAKSARLPRYAGNTAESYAH